MLQVILTVKSGLISLDSLQNDGRTRFSAHFARYSPKAIAQTNVLDFTRLALLCEDRLRLGSPNQKKCFLLWTSLALHYLCTLKT